jgi:hypothetical protein
MPCLRQPERGAPGDVRGPGRGRVLRLSGGQKALVALAAIQVHEGGARPVRRVLCQRRPGQPAKRQNGSLRRRRRRRGALPLEPQPRRAPPSALDPPHATLGPAAPGLEGGGRSQRRGGLGGGRRGHVGLSYAQQVRRLGGRGRARRAAAAAISLRAARALVTPARARGATPGPRPPPSAAQARLSSARRTRAGTAALLPRLRLPPARSPSGPSYCQLST